MTFFTLLLAVLTPHWMPQTSNSTAGLRGLSVVSSKVAWTAGTKGTILRTLDGGNHWAKLKIPNADSLDFRDIAAFNANTALVLASGTGQASRVYLTRNGGADWELVLTNPDQNGFFDALKFWDRQDGILLGDPVGGHFTIYTTKNGGVSWVRASGPPALEKEGAFAASGTCLTILGKREAWFGSGGPGGGRVFRTSDGGRNWTAALTPLSGGTESAGIFSLRFLDQQRGVAIGGDYQKPLEPAHSVAVSNDGGLTWNAPSGGSPPGFRSGITYLKRQKMLIAVGSNGSDYSLDGGGSWTHLSSDNLNAVASDGNHSVWAVGPKGAILALSLQP